MNEQISAMGLTTLFYDSVIQNFPGGRQCVYICILYTQPQLKFFQAN